ncbi:PhzF family phenazine biosynthesis isomerase [Streptomyces sp. NPDC059740]|uniref:PhzF family phenazine biosynthesis isomerase n=1 Tax=Streptomyces sp. NPDC059740 TaxID=3346926 RepID=UPI003668217A
MTFQPGRPAATEAASSTPDVLRYAAFTDTPGGGNPAGVVLDASGLDEVRMLALAAEVGYSETAFVTASDPAARRYRLRFFSPRAEVDFCGHATVATAGALAARTGPGPLVFDTPAGEIRVTTTTGDGPPAVTLTSVPTRSRPATADELTATLTALRWDTADLDPELPPHVAFGGNDHLVLAAGSRQRLADLDYDVPRLTAVMREYGWTTLQLLWREEVTETAGDPAGTTTLRFHSRNPFPVGGVYEDPATGAAAAALGGYLRALGAVDGPTRVRIRQGEDMGRPGELTLDLAPDENRSRVTGRVVPLAAGTTTAPKEHQAR